MLLLVALGAVTGLALGVVLAERSGGLDGLTSRVRGARKRRQPDEQDESGAADTPPDASEMLADDDEGGDTDGAYLPEEYDSAWSHPDEAELEARVLEVFRNDPTLRGRAIDIGAIGDGTIELTGWVHSERELAHALTLARGVPDVQDVMDSLTVRDTDRSRAGQSATDR
ncbi:MAG: BON domain-containing protein [Gemmatimonadaceae bacterium]|nr:BON domain-containing protein [Gemmatimonadaceae bacterium]